MATVDQIRVLVDDPSGVDQIFDDAHYTTILGIEENVYRAAATAARTLAAHYAAKTEVKAGPVAVKNQQKFEHYSKLARSFDQRAREGGGEEGGGVGAGAGAPQLTGTSKDAIDSLNSDSDRYGGVFRRGIDENPPSSDDDYQDCGS
jgi:hypothetical protein